MSSPRLLSNRYEIEDALGYGGMSEVHRGRDVRLGRDVAVKVLRADLARDPTFQLRFRREAQNAAALNHPAIVAVYDTGETDSENGPLPYIVMEYVNGRTLRDIVKTEGPLAPRRAMEVMADASAALDFSHRHGIVHRDVKPANIMITDSGAVKVMDFGIARAVADGQAAVTQTAAVIGTAQYLSPEQARGETVDARSDVYASGCVLYELLCGEPPFTGDSPVAVAYQHVREQPGKPSDTNRQVPAELDAVILKALSKNPENRYESAAEMRTDLVRVLSGQRPKAPLVMSEEERTELAAGETETTRVNTDHESRVAAAVPPDYDGDDEDHARRRRKRWTIGLVTAACVAVFAVLAGLAAVMFNGGGSEQPERIQLEKLTGMKVELARDKLDEAGFTEYKIVNKESESSQEGKIIDQKPGPGKYPPDEAIVLHKGTGPGSVKVPDLVGMTIQEARTALEEKGLEIGSRQREEVTDPDDVGKIIRQSATGTVSKDKVINVVLGKAIPKQQVPDVTELQVGGAKQNLTSLGFQVSTEEVASTRAAGTVVGQDPSGGSSVREGSEITLSVSDGSRMEMPGVLGLDESEAKSALRESGFRGDITTRKKAVSESSKEGTVVSTSPSTDSELDRNGKVTLHIGAEESETTPPTESSSPNGDSPFDGF
ncbi:serine/threonine-protein kinase [Actinopolyspora erythraea]|uniref:non-specific serine/threonine protein kinase n=1 Tax=Actinopolyspora erythraea TaxID=414996 RepID=A0A099DA14_9ACTN|nr:Stk1 family PASTA domain-containing Ser/Thr kinase [Actinopolyspora erythraea]ASU77005.1 serine/threonine-protein kinase [Actinopolyspora erythraea]KGI82998.1 serine/threonine protein kinase [Actinopolyspora erythraea]